MRASLVSNDKIELFRYIDNLSNESVKSFHDYFVKSDGKDFWDLLNDWQKDDIEAGLKDLKDHKSTPVSQVLAKYR